MRVGSSLEKPVAIYDGDCRFCGRWVELWRQKAGEEVEFIRLQDPELPARFPELKAEALQQAFHFIEGDGTVHYGAKAVYRLLAQIGEPAFDWAHNRVPGFALVSDRAYKVIAAQRTAISFLTRAFIPRKLASYDLVSDIFLRALGLIYLAAFWSLLGQVMGLIGSRGIMPIGEALAQSGGQLSFFDVPTLCLWNSSDGFLLLQCWAGAAFSLALLIGFAPWLCAILLWTLYLSLTVAGGVFLSFQWDNLLLEAGFLAIFLPRWGLWLTASGPSSRLVIWLFRWLMFRLMFESGCVKLLSGDETWWMLTALEYHYYTQPIPTPLAWHAYQLPTWVNAGLVLGMHAIELVLPFFIFIGRRARLLAAIGFASLQLGIMLTGNYGFFNLLTLVLCIPLLDDEWIARWRARVAGPFARGASRPEPFLARGRGHPALWWCAFLARALLLAVVLFMTAIQVLLVLRAAPKWPRAVADVYGTVAAFRSINAYGLFADMTTVRYEIEVEGSMDGETWVAYPFKHKPDDPRERPPQIGPHMPRLDWQMWFGALGTYDQNPWFVNFCARLLQNEPSVTRLLEANPFPRTAPKFVRARLYRYEFTSREERASTGQWWKREFEREYLPALSFRSRTVN